MDQFFVFRFSLIRLTIDAKSAQRAKKATTAKIQTKINFTTIINYLMCKNTKNYHFFGGSFGISINFHRFVPN